MKSRRIRLAMHVALMKESKMHRFLSRNHIQRDHLEDIGIDGTIILILTKKESKIVDWIYLAHNRNKGR
jgi:hypothetical protein